MAESTVADRMKAIVLTCDRYRALTAHMIARYDALWPDHPFRFRVACQHLPSQPMTDRMEYRRCPEAIKATALALLEDLSDDEWVYWCIDDKYPVAFDLPRVKASAEWTAHLREPEISGLLFCRCRKLTRKEHLTGHQIRDAAGSVYVERKGYEQIWLHQFLRVKVLRRLFEGFPDAIPQAKQMDEFKRRIAKPPEHRLFVARENLAVFGESTMLGKLTRNCWESIRRHRLALPEWFEGDVCESRTMGRLTVGQRLRLRLNP
jgi:hypothetical protein